MPRKSVEPIEETSPPSLDAVTDQMIKTFTVTGVPTILCAVSRKANLGKNAYESIDVLSAITLPIPDATVEDIESLKLLAMQMSEFGFNFTSSETGKRYNLIKDLQKEGNAADE